MADSLFDKLQRDAYRSGVQTRTDSARTWFRGKIKELGQVNRQSLLKDPALTPLSSRRPRIGQMYMYFYDPKNRETLPFYDAFPLILMVGPAPGGFYGLNLHYLSPVVRAKFLDKLENTLNNKKYDESTRYRLSYELLNSTKKFKEFAPCFKHYLTSHVDSKMVRVEASEWEIAIWLPTEQFRKKNKTHVWGNSRKQFGGG
jgi:hypothetical protein